MLKREIDNKYLMLNGNTEGGDVVVEPDPCEGTLAGFRYYWYFRFSGGVLTMRVYFYYDNSQFLAGDSLAYGSWTIEQSGNTVSGSGTSSPYFQAHFLDAEGFIADRPITITYSIETANGCERSHSITIDTPPSHPNGWHTEQAS